VRVGQIKPGQHAGTTKDRGMGVDIAKAALAAGYAVVATGRDPGNAEKVVGAADDLLTTRLFRRRCAPK
jgi:NAD(P)-dependent dehydrogenase (short-subunit alcohol dehydrogenase family)